MRWGRSLQHLPTVQLANPFPFCNWINRWHESLGIRAMLECLVMMFVHVDHVAEDDLES